MSWLLILATTCLAHSTCPIGSPPAAVLWQTGTEQQEVIPRLRLAQAKSVAFKVKVWYGEPDDHGRVTFVQGQFFAVKAARPASLRIEALPLSEDPSMPNKPGDNVLHVQFRVRPFDVLITNGHEQLQLAHLLHKYFMSQAAPTLARIRSRSGLIEIVNTDFLFKDDLHVFRSAGTAKIGGQTVQVYRCSMSNEEVKVQYALYVDPTTHLPVRISRFVDEDTGKYVEDHRADYSDWQIDPPLPASTFDPTPPADAKPGE